MNPSVKRFALLCIGLSTLTARAQISLVASNAGLNEVALGQAYIQSFDTLPASGSVTWVDNTTLKGWYANHTAGQVSAGNLVATSFGTISAVNSGSVGASATLNSLGGSGSTNRALGGTPSAYASGSGNIFSSQSVNVVLRIKNSTGSVLTGMRVAYDTVATSTANKDAVALAYRVFNAGAGTISSGFIETHRYLNTFNGNYNESMRTEYGRVVSSTAGWTCVVKDIAPTSTNPTNSLEFKLKDLAVNPGDEVWLAWHIAKEDEQGTSDPITTTAIDNVSLSDFTVGRPGLPVITAHPRTLAVVTGGTRDFALNVAASGSSLTYQWKLNGTNLPGATAPTYAGVNVNSAFEGTYEAVVTSSGGIVTSLPAFVNIYSKKTITTNLDVSFASYSSGISQLQAAAGGTLCDLYYPTNLASGAAAPAVIVLHGGGGNNGDKSDSREVQAGVELAQRGWFVMVINYAMSSSTVQCWPYNLWDAKQAVRWLKQRADAGTYNIDKTKIGALGFSWGCNLGSMLAMTGTNDDVGVVTSTLKVEPPVRGNSYDSYSTEIQCSAVFYGACDIPNYHQMNQFVNFTAWDNRTLYRRASPVRYPNRYATPMLVSHGTADDDVWPNQTEAMYAMQRSQGARLEPYLMVPGGQHSFYLFDSSNVEAGFPSPIDVRPETIGFFEKYLVETNVRPAILTEPVSKIANGGASVTLSVEASGVPTPSFQWRKDGVIVPGATSSNYTFTASAVAAGYFDVVVSNVLGALPSTAALLTVDEPLPPLPPVANADSATTISNTPVTINVLVNDTDANGDTLTIVSVTQGTNGSVVINGGTNVTYTPNASYVGTDFFTYTISDGNAGTNSAGVTITVTTIPTDPPVITTQPQSQTVNVGANVTFNVVAGGTAPLRFQWSKGASSISGATNSSYLLTSVTTNDAGIFSVVITNAFGSATSSNATLVVNVPQSSFVSNFTASGTWLCPTGVTSVQVECWGAGGGGGGSTSTARCGGGGGGGAYVQNASLAVVPGTTYTVTVGTGGTAGGTTVATSPGGAGSASSFSGPSITTITAVGGLGGGGGTSTTPNGTNGPGTSVGNAGFSGALSFAGGNGAAGVAATRTGGGGGAAGANGIGGNASSSAVTGGTAAGPVGGNGANGTSTANTGGTAGTAPGGGGSGGYNAAAGAGARGQITLTYSLASPTAPTITQHPLSQTNSDGYSVTLTVTAAGTAPLAYQWRKSNSPISGATAASLNFNPATTNDSGNYDVVVTNLYGSVTSSVATLLITPPVPTNMIFASSWATIRDGANFTVDIDELGVGYVLTKFSTNGASAKTYLEFNLAGQNYDPAQNATLNVTRHPNGGTQRIRLWALNQSYPAMSANLIWATAQANETNSNSMLTNGALTATPLLELQSPGGAGSNTFTIPAPWGQFVQSNRLIFAFCGVEAINPETNSAAGYRIMITNSAQLPTFTFATNTPPSGSPPTITNQPQSLVECSGGSAAFSVTAGGTSPLAYQWRRNVSPLTGQTNSTMMLTSLTTNNSGNYEVIITNSFGSITSSVAVLTVNPSSPVGITVQPTNQTVFTGGTVSFDVGITNVTAANYQWMKFTNAIANATNASLVLSNVAAGDSGDYSVLVLNSCNSATSTVATLTVVQAPATPPQLDALLVTTNGDFQFTFTNTPGANFTVLCTTNITLPLTNWTPLGAATEVSPGQFQFSDPSAITNYERYYRVRSP